MTIETRNITVDAGAADELRVAPGAYVRLAVSDTGSGMAPDVAARAFDPFFTTKGVGKGTGLGLSQVFGFARQSGGHVTIETAPGQGTRVVLLLPRHSGTLSSVEGARGGATIPHGAPHETILVVEDEERVRSNSVEVLRELGYTVVAAADAREALQLIAGDRRIDLVFTDIVMPDMTGDELARQARLIRPSLTFLFTSGYAPDAMYESGLLDDDAPILAKPFGIESLARRVRAAIDSSG